MGSIFEIYDNGFSLDGIMLNIQALVVLPTETIFALPANKYFNCGYNPFDDDNKGKTFYENDGISQLEVDKEDCFMMTLMACCCCYIPSVLLSTLCCFGNNEHYMHPDFRIGISMIEWIILIGFGISDYVNKDDENVTNFLFDQQYGLYVFIVGILFYFVLPHKVSIRGKWGYAFNGELEELKRMKDENILKKIVFKRIHNSQWNITEGFIVKHINAMRDDINISFTNLKMDGSYMLIVRLINVSIKWSIKDLDILQENMQNELNDMNKTLEWKKNYTNIHNEQIDTAFVNPWDEIQGYSGGTTPAMFALSNGHYNIVEWLESEKLAKRHKEIFENQTKFTKMDEEFARYYIGNEYWGEPSNDLS